ncbi:MULTISPECIES: TonB-dependent receptor domain-containing protein [Pseudoalteromonas]|uniref:TonB-dependent receptor n=1 Tax=Pseudoalteromonas amylolytica TaxID=1859457 RepID=A0A1S1MMI9_9GAMM|nr:MULTISPECIES: TonB-dependent receptor [Pseudoalteromonas]OHU86282.1 TonB-dependent receptor [Pseudoalteromonas sp. JW3]OHU89613.1 TonB-dependent receptor [Pseudoalteromonas amylolytica]
MRRKNPTWFALSVITLAISANAWAQEQAPNSTKQKNELEKIIVTGVPQKRTVMASSVSVSSISGEQINVSTPRTTAEAFRILPGVRSESTGGEGNANIAVRGLPVASGGAKFLQLQEDGLPILQFGDIAFGNADIFMRLDNTIQTVESIRGGSASTAASNAPGGIINFISKTGESESGSIATTFGLDYDEFRTDFEFGSYLSDSVRFHIGGFVRQGEGVRNTGYTGNKGGQIKANLTKEFDNGYVRVYFKHLDDKSTGYLPMPMRANGDSLSGFDALEDTPHSAYFINTQGLGANNEIRQGDMRDGMHPQVNSLGVEASFDLSNNWQVENRFRVSSVKGTFNAPFPAEIGDAQDIATSIAGENASLKYANGPQATMAVNDENIMRIHTFDVQMRDFGSLVNDIKLTKTLQDDTTITLGFYASEQTIAMSWLWNSYLMELKGDNAALIDVFAEDGTSYSDNGLYAYGTPAWGNCCQRNYDTDYSTRAPYLAVSSQFGDITVDASVRYDWGDATGTYAGAVVSERDVNGDGVISKPEEQVAGIDLANPDIVNYDWNYTSYSIGANYQINNSQAAFARISEGARANADRLLFGKVAPDGSVAKEDAIDEVTQVELGFKQRFDNGSLFATAFYAQTEEQNFEATSQRFFDRQYEAQGIELEGIYFVGSFDFRGNLTWTDAEIAKDALSPEVVGHTPRRQADFIYSLMGRYNMEQGAVGVSLIGTSDAYAQDNNDLKLDGYTQVNAFASYDVTQNLSISLNVNNLFNAVGITEAEEGSIPSNNIIRARSINGRTTSFTLKYQF